MKRLVPVLLVAAILVPVAWSSLVSTPWRGARWEYRVVGVGEIHGTTLDYLGEALNENEGKGLFGLMKGADEKLARKTEDLLNVMGGEGWELIESSSTSMIFKRPLE